MAARIDYKASVAKDLRGLGQTTAQRILRRVERALASEGHQGKSLSGEFAGLYRLEVGDYRVIYARTDEGYLVLRIGHRREVYRKGRPGGSLLGTMRHSDPRPPLTDLASNSPGASALLVTS